MRRFLHVFWVFLRVFLGCLGLLFGVAISGWIVFNLFSPQPEFKESLQFHRDMVGSGRLGTALLIPRLLVPLVMIWVGWRWIRGKKIR